MDEETTALLALALLGGLFVMKSPWKQPPSALASGLNRSLDVLHAPFRAKVERVLGRLRALGYTPVVHETQRSKARAEALQRRGTGISRSMHVLGLAVDVLPAPNSWPAGTHPFWRALGEAAAAEGLEWGGTWQKRDMPHLQMFDTRFDARLWAASERGELPAFIDTIGIGADDSANDNGVDA